ncbi:MAG: SIMPL domain-containing protein [Patescibacteria group bacterium]|nr:SIMPL domain-containing protein [Patescibacteria group bacterium]
MEQENCSHHGKFKMIVVLVLVLGAVALGVLAILRDKIMQNDQYQFSVTAQGKVTAPPDIATTDFSVQSAISKNIGDIVKDGNTKMNAIIAALTALKIDKADIQTTQYQLNPIYNYPVIFSGSNGNNSNQTVLQGYQLTEGITVKIRNLNIVGDAIQAAISAGANQTGGVSFTIDDQDKLKGEARADAIAKAVQKADDIAKQSGLKLGKLINVSENVSPIPYYANSLDMKALGGGIAASAPTPSIQSGSLEITDDVILTYKVK